MVRHNHRRADPRRAVGGVPIPETAAAAVAAPVGPLVTLWLDDARVGTGYRTFVVLLVGSKHAHLFHWPTLTRIKVPKETLRTAYDVTYGTFRGPKSVAKAIREKVEVFKRVGREVPEVTVAEALAVLKGV